MSKAKKKQAPEPAAVFQWAVTRDSPTIAEAAAHFGCSQQAIEDAVETADIPGAYLGLVVAIRYGNALCDLSRGKRQVEAYYAPDDK